MKKEETAPLEILKIALDINNSNLSKIHWQETFIDYIKENNAVSSQQQSDLQEKIKQKTEPIIESITHHRLQ